MYLAGLRLGKVRAIDRVIEMRIYLQVLRPAKVGVKKVHFKVMQPGKVGVKRVYLEVTQPSWNIL